MGSRLKIVHLLYSGLGGHGNVFFSLFRADKSNLFNYFGLFTGIEPMRQEYIRECLNENIPYMYVKKHKSIDLKCYFNIVKCFIKEKPHIIFLHGGTFILPAFLYKFFMRRCKIIVRDTQAHHLKSISDWIFLVISLLLAYKTVFLTKESLASAKRIIKCKYLFNNSLVIGNGINLNGIEPVCYSKRSCITIGMQGRLQLNKDHETLLQAFAIVLQKFHNRKIFLKLAGSGDCFENLNQLAIKLGISEKVTFCGLLNQSELIEFMSQLDIYVHASFGETMSTSVMQAMGFGLPIVASNVPGINNMVKDALTGVLVPVSNPIELADQLSKLISNNTLRRDLGRKARDFALTNYSSESMYLKYRELFLEC